MPENENIVEQVVDTIPIVKPRLGIKKVLLYIVTFYFLILILKYVFKFVWKCLGFLRRYIHDLTDETKFGEVFLWTIIGMFLGVLLYNQLVWLWDWFVDFLNTNVFPML